MPICAIVENASIRLKCRCDHAMMPPSIAVAAPQSTSSSVCATHCDRRRSATNTVVERAWRRRTAPSGTMIAGEDHRDRAWRHRVRVRQPELQRHHAPPLISSAVASRQNAAMMTGIVGPPRHDRFASAREIERADAGIDQPDAAQHQVAADAVGDGEVERALQRRDCSARYAGQREGGDAHHLEPDEQVEQIVGQQKPIMAGQEHQHQNVEMRARPRRSSPRRTPRSR